MQLKFLLRYNKMEPRTMVQSQMRLESQALGKTRPSPLKRTKKMQVKLPRRNPRRRRRRSNLDKVPKTKAS